MRSAGFAYLGLAKLLLSTDQALSKPMLSFPEPQQVKKTPLNGKKKAWNIHISRERHHSVHREKCRYTEANLVLAQLTHSPQGLPAVAAVSKQNRLHSSQKCGTTASGLGLLLPQNGKELVLSAMGRKQAGDPDPSSCDGNSVGWVGADIHSLLEDIFPMSIPCPQIHFSLGWLSRSSPGEVKRANMAFHTAPAKCLLFFLPSLMQEA